MSTDLDNPIERFRRTVKLLDMREEKGKPRFDYEMALIYQKRQRDVEAWRRKNIRAVT